MQTEDEHPFIRFAQKYRDPMFDYLNAYIAIARLDSLNDDLEQVAGLLEKNSPHESRWHPWFAAEAISYYAVGYATCLEWHAKSRLIDLFSYKPSALKVADVQKTISDKLIVQMVAKQASVVELVGAALKVSNLTTYFSVINRVFSELNFGFSLKDWLTGSTDKSTVCWLNPRDIADVEIMFEFRHTLVHEIGISVMGHPNVRDLWTPDEARRKGKIVGALMKGVEDALSRFAPQLFPNLLDQDGYPISSTDTLRAELARLDAKCEADMQRWEWNNDTTATAWADSKEKFADYMAAEEEFISTASMLHWRYFDARTPLRTRMLNYRIGFLTEIMSHFSTADDDNPDVNNGSDDLEEKG